MQIDNRALKAVAIEHKKDVDAAALAVLNEIIPYLSDKSAPASPLARSVSNDGSSHGNIFNYNLLCFYYLKWCKLNFTILTLCCM